jgi:hypothetical protein
MQVEIEYTEDEEFIMDSEYEIKLLTKECGYCDKSWVHFVEGDGMGYCATHRMDIPRKVDKCE